MEDEIYVDEEGTILVGNPPETVTTITMHEFEEYRNEIYASQNAAVYKFDHKLLDKFMVVNKESSQGAVIKALLEDNNIEEAAEFIHGLAMQYVTLKELNSLLASSHSEGARLGMEMKRKEILRVLGI